MLGAGALGEEALGLAAGEDDDDGAGEPPPKQPESVSIKARPIDAGRYRTDRAFMGKV